MKKFAFAITLLILMVSCKKEHKEKTEAHAQKFETEQVVRDASNIASCKDKDCPDIDLVYTRVKEDSNFGQRINQNNEKELIQILHLAEDQPLAQSVDQALDEFVEEYFKFKKIDSLTHTSYEAQIEQSIKSQNDKTLVFKTSYYIYTGGAHGYGAVLFSNYDAQTGKLLQKKDLIDDLPSFKDFVEEKFRLQYQIPETANINSKGFFFDDDQFVLPENIAVTDKEVILVYNPYEVASYAEGQLRFVFPKESVEKWLKY